MKPSLYRPFAPAFKGFFNEFLPKNMNSMFDGEDFFTTPAVNVKETESGFHLEVAAPGLQKEDFKLAVENNILTISAEKEKSTEDQTDNYTRKEFQYASFKRSFQLPEHIQDDKILATYNNGVLTIDLPKNEATIAPKGRTIEIK